MNNPALCSASPAAHLAGSAVFSTRTQQQRSSSQTQPDALCVTSQSGSPSTFAGWIPSCLDQGSQSLSSSVGHRAETWGRCSLEDLCFASPPLDRFGVSIVDCSAEVSAARAPAAVSIQPERLVIRWLDQSATNLAIGSMIQSRANHKSQLPRNITGWHYSTDERTMQPATALLCLAGLEIRKARAGGPPSLAPWPERCYNRARC